MYHYKHYVIQRDGDIQRFFRPGFATEKQLNFELIFQT